MKLDLGAERDERFLSALSSWIKNGTKNGIDPSPIPQKMSLVLGFPLWGKSYIERFFENCLPSLCCDENKTALKDSLFVIFTREKDKKYFDKFPFSHQIYTIPENIIEQVKEHANNKYWLLGFTGYLSLQIAHGKGYGYHMLMPDFVYSKEFFTNLFRLSRDHEAIAQTTISSDIKTFPKLQKNGKTEISARDLGNLGYEHLHPISKALIMNGKDVLTQMPNCHSLIWINKNEIAIYSCHLNLTYISPRLIRKISKFNGFNPLDTSLPFLMPGDVYVPIASDNMVHIELSGRRTVAKQNTPLELWVFHSGATTFFKNYHDRFFKLKSVIPIHTQYEYCTEDKMNNTQEYLSNVLIKSRKAMKKIYEEA